VAAERFGSCPCCLLEGSLPLFARTVRFGADFHQARPAIVVSLAARSGASGTALRVVFAVDLGNGCSAARFGGLRIGAGGQQGTQGGQRDDEDWHSHVSDPLKPRRFGPSTCPNPTATMRQGGVDRALGQRHTNGPVGPERPGQGPPLSPRQWPPQARLWVRGIQDQDKGPGCRTIGLHPRLAQTKQTLSGAHA